MQDRSRLAKIDRADVILPSPNEFKDFKIGSIGLNQKSNSPNPVVFELRGNDSGVLIEFQYMSFKKKTSDRDVFGQVLINGAKFYPGGFTRLRIGEVAFHSYCKDPEECFLVIMDGSGGIFVSILSMPFGNLDGKDVRGAINPSYLRLAENIAGKMLDRMTVLGLTSKSKESAPEWAKKQVAERLTGRKD